MEEVDYEKKVIKNSSSSFGAIVLIVSNNLVCTAKETETYKGEGVIDNLVEVKENVMAQFYMISQNNEKWKETDIVYKKHYLMVIVK